MVASNKQFVTVQNYPPVWGGHLTTIPYTIPPLDQLLV